MSSGKAFDIYVRPIPPNASFPFGEIVCLIHPVEGCIQYCPASDFNKMYEEHSALLAEKDKEIAKLRAALEDAVQAVNTMQTLLMQSGLVTNSGAVSTNIKLAFNRGAKFLSDNSEMQTAYLKRVYKQREALAGIPHEEVRKFVETAGDAPRRNKDET